MADGEEEDLPSKRFRLSPERESYPLDRLTDIESTFEAPDDAQVYFPASVGSFEDSTLTGSDRSREQNGGQSDFQDLDKLGSDDFPSCFSVEDDQEEYEDHDYKPIAGPMGWVQRQMNLGVSPRDILAHMVPHAQVPPEINDVTLWKVVIDILTEPNQRQKLPHVNTLDDVVNLIGNCRSILVLTGAGVSVPCGIPDFRSRDGIYARLSVEYPDLPDPQAMFDITYFNQNPRPFFKFAKEMYPGQFQPSLCHRFIQLLEKHGHLLKNYSQNIDTLEQIAGITRVIQCHGSFSTASCTSCKYQVISDDIKEDIFNQKIPLCPKCSQDDGVFAVMKPDIVFFGESLPSDFYSHLEEDSQKADLLIVIGSSLKVRPVALIPSHISPNIPQVLINREPLRHMTFDVELLGDCDVIVAELCKRLGGHWVDILDGFTIPPVKMPPCLVLPSELAPYDAHVDCDDNDILQKPVDEGSVAEEEQEKLPKEAQETVGQVDGEEQQEKTQDICLYEQQQCEHQLQELNNQNQQHDQEQLQLDNEHQKEVQRTNEQPEQDYKHQQHDVQQPRLDQHDSNTDLERCCAAGEDTDLATGHCDKTPTDTLVAASLAPEQCAGQSNEDSSEDPPLFIFLPPSRYIFSGAEISNSPLTSPRADVSHLVPSSDEESDSENGSNSGSGSTSGSTDSKNRLNEQNERSHMEGSGYSSDEGSEGYGSGVPLANDLGVPSTNELGTSDLKLITGRLYSYSCASEENSTISASDLFIDGNKGTVNDLLQKTDDVLVSSVTSHCHDVSSNIGATSAELPVLNIEPMLHQQLKGDCTQLPCSSGDENKEEDVCDSDMFDKQWDLCNEESSSIDLEEKEPLIEMNRLEMDI